MKPFFQGLVFGVLVMYGYLNYSVDIFGSFRKWLGGASENLKHDRMRKEVDDALHGFLFQHTPERQRNEKIVRH